MANLIGFVVTVVFGVLVSMGTWYIMLKMFCAVTGLCVG